jgi:hypothetical protein
MMRETYSRVGVARDLAEIKAGVPAIASGGEYDVAGTHVGADAVGEGDEEWRPLGS